MNIPLDGDTPTGAPKPSPRSDIYKCPIDSCEWKHTAPAIYELPEGITPDQLGEYSAKRTKGIEDALSVHFTGDHTGVEWANEVGRLRQLLLEQPPLICRGCYVERHMQKTAGQPLRPQNLAQLVVDGNGMCPTHVRIQDSPVIPGRTASGLILGRTASGLILGNGQAPPPVGG